MQRALQGLGAHLKHTADHTDPLTPEQAIVLALLPTEPQSVMQIERSIYAGTNISYNLRKLEEYGFVERIGDERDARRRLVRRTEAGTALAGLIGARVAAHVGTAWRDLPDALAGALQIPSAAKTLGALAREPA